MTYEMKRNKLEDNLLDGTIDRDTYKRKHDELNDKIAHFDEQVQEIESQSKMDINLIEEVLVFTRNNYQAYYEAPPFLKRHYLRSFMKDYGQK
jgi:hypothetical protein